MKTLLNKEKYFILLFSIIFLPSPAFASSVYIDSNNSEFFVGDTIILNVRIDSLGKKINVIEGEVLLNHEVDIASLVDINTTGSEFSLWPIKPLPSEQNTLIYFTGGLPGGFISGNAIIFNIVLKLQKIGQISLLPNNIKVYIHDGKGTKDEVNLKGLTINVLPKKPNESITDNWNNIILNDKTPPEPFVIYFGQEDSVFDGKKFLSFNTVDKQSGVKYYEVTEDNLPTVRSGNTYILQEQNKPVKVMITAYDSAGNATQSTYNPKQYKVIYLIIAIIIIVLIIIIRKIRKK